MLSTSTSKIFLNGIPGKAIRHGKGMWQGDPLSFFLFIMEMDSLQRLLDKEIELGMISKLRGKGVCFRTSMYTDNTTVFVNPNKEDM